MRFNLFFISYSTKNAEGVYDKNPFTMTSCSTVDAAKLSKPIEGDYDETLSRLHFKYEKKQIDAILLEFRNLRGVPNGDHKGFSNLLK